MFLAWVFGIKTFTQQRNISEKKKMVLQLLHYRESTTRENEMMNMNE